MQSFLTNLLAAAKSFFAKYTVLTHLMLMLWNVFMATWATKLSVMFYGFNISASSTVVWIQQNLHLPTWFIGLITLILNGVLLYNNFKTQSAKNFEAKKQLGIVDDNTHYTKGE